MNRLYNEKVYRKVKSGGIHYSLTPLDPPLLENLYLTEYTYSIRNVFNFFLLMRMFKEKLQYLEGFIFIKTEHEEGMYLLVLICLISEYGRQQTHLSMANIFLQKDSLQNTCPATCPVGQVILVQDKFLLISFCSFQDRYRTFLCNCVPAMYKNGPFISISTNFIIILTCLF